MKKIVILDTWTSNTNLGNKIICEAVEKELRKVFPQDFFYRVPALEYASNGVPTITYRMIGSRELVNQADYVFLAGTNLLSADMDQTSQWCIHAKDTVWNNKVILMGLGWWQYQPQTEINQYTRSLLHTVLNKDYLHSVRESYARDRLQQVGIQAINTGCPSMWELNRAHCAAIKHSKSDNLLLTFTEYNQQPPYDKLLFEIVERNYSTIYFWPQMYGDYEYARQICGDRVIFLAPSLESLDEVLTRGNIDYIGTRLHAGIRALQHRSRTLVIGIDNRAIEKMKDFNLPVIPRGEVATLLEHQIRSAWTTNLNLDEQAITLWKNQFVSTLVSDASEKLVDTLPPRLFGLEKASSSQRVELFNHQILPISATVLMQQAQQALTANDFTSALNLLSQAKALKQPVKNLDMLRAMCFLKLNQAGAAWQALLEELRYFPDNADAKNWLHQIETQVPQLKAGQIKDAEFQELLNLVRPYTMLSEARLYSLFSLVKRICMENMPGNIVECGVAGGGSTALMALVIKRYTKQVRWLYAFDSFDGMPPPTQLDKHQGMPAEATGWATGTCAGSEEHLRNLCTRLGIADLVKPVKGYFQDTLPKMRNWVGMIAVLHLDGDWYESTKVILHHLYDRVVNNGCLQVDDYGYWEGCRQAIHEFETSRSLRFEVNQIDDTGVWFIKPDKFPLNSVLAPQLVNEFFQDDPVTLGLQSQMSQNERFQLYYALRKLLPTPSAAPLRFIEIGSFAGASLWLTCQALKRVTPHFQGFAIEPGNHPQFTEVLKHVQQHVTHLPMLSHQAVAQLHKQFQPDGNFPVLIFVDGDHTYEGVWRDAMDYFQLLAPGGLMVFHDYLPPLNDANREAILFHHGGKEPGIRQAFEELVECTYGEVVEIPLLSPTDPTQTQAYLPIIPGVVSTIRAYRKAMI